MSPSMTYENETLYIVQNNAIMSIYCGQKEEKILNGTGGTDTAVNGIRRGSVLNLT